MSRLLLVRHGQSEWNADGRWQGQADPPLTELGVRQARTAAGTLGTFDVVASSDLERARHTAEIVADVIGVGPVEVDPALRERHAGEWQGLTRVEIERDYPGYLGDGRRPPGYEDDQSVGERMAPALTRLAELVDGGIGFVSVHAGVIYNMEARLGLTFERIPNLGGRWIEGSGARFVARERVLLVDLERVPATTPDQI